MFEKHERLHIKATTRTGSLAVVVERLPSKREALDSIPLRQKHKQKNYEMSLRAFFK